MAKMSQSVLYSTSLLSMTILKIIISDKQNENMAKTKDTSFLLITKKYNATICNNTIIAVINLFNIKDIPHFLFITTYLNSKPYTKFKNYPALKLGSFIIFIF